MNARASAGAGALRASLDVRRQHFQHGPIDLVLAAWGDSEAVRAAYERAWRRFDGLLEELVSELALLRSRVQDAERAVGTVARRMVRGCRPFGDVFITPMAAVAGAVADEILAALAADPRIRRAYVNNGGDIALHLADGERLAVGLVSDPAQAMRHGRLAALDGRFEVEAAMPVRGVATSGWRGRSWSLGIADSVTILATSAAAADAAATIIANAVDIEHPAVRRAPASAVDDNTDLGDRLVTLEVGPLPSEARDAALARGVRRAAEAVGQGLIWGAVLVLQGDYRVVGGAGRLATTY
jgi:ApbE superfamily uncharacterized protein (UPF0280 family)